jgi:hypothetical protein
MRADPHLSDSPEEIANIAVETRAPAHQSTRVDTFRHANLARQHIKARASTRSATQISRASTFRDEKLARQRFPRVPQIGARKSVRAIRCRNWCGEISAEIHRAIQL